MNQSSKARKIGILGHVGNGNLGDEAIIAALIQQIRQRCPSAEVYAFTSNPVDTRERHEIAAFPIRPDNNSNSHQLTENGNLRGPDLKRYKKPFRQLKVLLKARPRIYNTLKRVHGVFCWVSDCLRELRFLTRSFKTLRQIDVLIIAGSNQLFDYFGGSWGFPYALFTWSLLAKVSRTKLIFLSVGAGPINSRLSSFFIKHSLRWADYRSYRDESSHRLIESLGVPGPSFVVPDLALSIDTTKVTKAARFPPTAGFASTVGINPMPLFADHYWPETNHGLYQDYLEKLALFSLWLIQKGHNIFFFPTQLRADPPVIADIKILMSRFGTFEYEPYIVDGVVSGFADLIQQISLTDMVIATRYHAILFSCLSHKPVLGLSYHKKIDDLMVAVDQGKYVLDATCFSVDSLVKRFLLLQTEKEVIRAQLRRRVFECQRELERQYDEVLRV